MASTALPIHVTQPHLPALDDFVPLLREIWDSKVLTNGGPFHQRLEAALAEHLGVPHIALFANATIALVTALQALRVTGEVITTPYSFVATAHSLLWNGLEPVFVDIDPDTLNLDPARIEAAITPHTTAILPVHCYGRPCEVDAIQRIADAYGLKVIYDAAHAFGVRTAAGSVLNHGDLSVLSFHATKVFNTFEGGAIVCPDARTKTRIDHLKNFGFVDELTVVAPGINGKMSEFNAALGLLQLREIDAAIARRREIDARYRAALAELPGIRCVAPNDHAADNHSYFPILVGPEYPLARDALYARLKAQGIHGRRYFHPLITQFPMYRGLASAAPSNLPVATRIAQQVICLPIHPALADADVDRVCASITEAAAASRGAMSFYSEAELRQLGLARVGVGVKLSRRAALHGAERIALGDHCRIDDFCVISAGAGGIAIGRHVHIAAFCPLLAGAARIELHDYAGLSSRVSIYSSSDDYSGAHMSNPTVPREYTAPHDAPVTLGRHVIVGCGSIVLPGVTLHEGSGVGALSLIRRDCEPFGLYAGMPAKRVSRRRDTMIALGDTLEADACMTA